MLFLRVRRAKRRRLEDASQMHRRRLLRAAGPLWIGAATAERERQLDAAAAAERDRVTRRMLKVAGYARHWRGRAVERRVAQQAANAEADAARGAAPPSPFFYPREWQLSVLGGGAASPTAAATAAATAAVVFVFVFVCGASIVEAVHCFFSSEAP